MTTMERLSAALADRYRIERELGQGGMAMIRELTGRTGDLVYVENWLPELRAKVKKS